jgi:hypothetical protein
MLMKEKQSPSDPAAMPDGRLIRLIRGLLFIFSR